MRFQSLISKFISKKFANGSRKLEEKISKLIILKFFTCNTNFQNMFLIFKNKKLIKKKHKKMNLITLY